MKNLLPKTANNPKGFTLVELLVTISIIAILAVIGVTVFNNVQKNARDARRRADVDSISAALEARYDGNLAAASRYPIITTGFFAGGSIPRDPSDNTTAYVYVSGASEAAAGSTYQVCADLESDLRGASDVTAGVGGVNTQDYCKSAQQQ